MRRTLALIQREMWRFQRSALLIGIVTLSPLLQLVVLGYAFGGTLHNLQVALVDEDHGVPALKLREMTGAIAANARTYNMIPYQDEATALRDMQVGKMNAVLTIPPGFSRRVLAKDNPRVGLVLNNADKFVSATLTSAFSDITASYASGAPSQVGSARVPSQLSLDVIEFFPYVPYIEYLLPGTIVLAIFTMVMIGGAFSFMDDKTLGLHEGYFVSPVTKLEMVAAFTISGAIKAVIAGIVLLVIGLIVAGVPHPLEPTRLGGMILVIALTAFALVNIMFMLMVRINDPMVPRIASMVLNTLLFFPSGAVYPTQAFPAWMRAIAAVDPFTYAVHALRGLLIQGAGISAMAGDLAVLAVSGVVTMCTTALIFRRTL